MTDLRDDNLNNVWAAIRSLREQRNSDRMVINDRLTMLESWRTYIEATHNELKTTLSEINQTLNIMKEQNAEIRGAKQAEKRMIALWSALGGGGSVASIEILSKFIGG